MRKKERRRTGKRLEGKENKIKKNGK